MREHLNLEKGFSLCESVLAYAGADFLNGEISVKWRIRNLCFWFGYQDCDMDEEEKNSRDKLCLGGKDENPADKL